MTLKHAWLVQGASRCDVQLFNWVDLGMSTDSLPIKLG